MASEGLSLENVGALRVVDLKEELKTRGLATDGKKVKAIGVALRYSRSDWIESCDYLFPLSSHHFSVSSGLCCTQMRFAARVVKQGRDTYLSSFFLTTRGDSGAKTDGPRALLSLVV